MYAADGGDDEGALATRLRELVTDTNDAADWELLSAFLRAYRSTGGPVFGVNDDVVLMNNEARHMLEPSDQAVLLDLARQVLGAVASTILHLDFPSGSSARIHCRRIDSTTDTRGAGALIHVEFRRAHTTDIRAHPSRPIVLPGIVGSAPLWRRCCRDIDTSYRSGEWITLTGEPGVGKHTLAASAHQHHHPGVWSHTLEALHSGEEGWLHDLCHTLHPDPPAALILRHAEHLTPAAADTLTDLLTTLTNRPDPPWVAATLTPQAETTQQVARLLGLFARTVEVPPLRQHIEDLPDLVPHLLATLHHTGALTCSSSTLNLLRRADWPGNIAELRDLLTHIARTRRQGTIQPSDLPPDYRTANGRALTALESLERETITQALRNTGGNKTQAAKHLGLSRATIYRKLHEYRITTPHRITSPPR